MNPTHDPGLLLSPRGQRITDRLAAALFIAGFVGLMSDDILPAFISATLWWFAIALHKWVDVSRDDTNGELR